MYPLLINISSFTAKLKSSLLLDLPGIQAHKSMIPDFPRDSPIYFNNDTSLRDAAVLIILFEDEGRIKTVFIERTPDSGPHSGQIAFPGGRKEISDQDLVETALREAEEEIGVTCKRENFIGSLTPVQIQVSGFSVLPVICTIEKLPQFVICEKEVRDVFVVDLEDLLGSETVKTITVRDMQIHAPSFIADERIIWGATAMVLKELKTLIL